MKKVMSLLLVIALCLSMGTIAFADEAVVAENSDSELHRIPGEGIEEIVQRHKADATANASVQSQTSVVDVNDLMEQRMEAAITSANDAVVAQIDAQLAANGYYVLTDEDMADILASDSSGQGPNRAPSKPPNTKYITFTLQTGTTPSGMDYANIGAWAQYNPSTAYYVEESKPLYICSSLDIFPPSNNWTQDVLRAGLELAASEVFGSNFLSGILLTPIASFIIDECFVNSNTFSASCYGTVYQNMQYSYVEEAPDYYTHFVTTEQCEVRISYYYLSQNDGPKSWGTDLMLFNSEYHGSPHLRAEEKVNDGDYSREDYSCGTISLKYRDVNNNLRIKVVPKPTYYSTVTSLPGV